MENFSYRGVDHWRGYGARCRIHVTCAQKILLRRGSSECPNARGPRAGRCGLGRGTGYYSGGKMGSLPAHVRNARCRTLSETFARSYSACRRDDEVLKAMK